MRTTLRLARNRRESRGVCGPSSITAFGNPSCTLWPRRAKERLVEAGAGVADAFGDRRGRVYRVERRREPQRGRPQRYRRERLGSATDGKWRNLQKRQLADIVPPADLFRWLDGRKLDAVIHSARFPTRPPPTASRDGRQFPSLAQHCSTGARRPARRSSMRLRPRPMATAIEGFADDWSPARAAVACGR